MLVIISDLHLGDGTTADSIPASAFYLFAKRLRQDAHFAAISHGKYKPIENLDVILMGDILDPLHSTGWLFPLKEEQVEHGRRITEPGDEFYVRPWSDQKDPRFAKKLKEVTEAILEYNREGLEVFRKLAAGEIISFDAEDGKGGRLSDEAKKRPLQVHFHYMVGNHDWYYHLKGPAFDEIRRRIIDAMGLRNQPACPFPFDLSETRPASHSEYTEWRSDLEDGNDDAQKLNELLKEYRVFARHGDYYDMFNFDIQKGRDHPTLGDAFTMEVCNRFPEQLTQGMGNLNISRLRQMTNVRPALATPLWVTGQLKRISDDLKASLPAGYKEDWQKQQKIAARQGLELTKLPRFEEADLKRTWDELCEKFLNLDLVHQKDKWGFDTVDMMQLVVRVSKKISSKQLDDLIYMIQNKNAASRDRSFARFALEEPAFLNDSARYIVYGHTHHHENVPLDYDEGRGSQVYFNSGTWHTYFDLARKNPKEKKFVPYKALTYITFFKSSENGNPNAEHGDQNFETWSGAYA